MSTLRRILIIGLVLASFTGIAAMVVLKKESANNVIATLPDVAIEFAPSDLAEVQVQDLSRTLPITGTFSAVNWAYVKSRVAGDMREVLVREGESVKKGQVIARIDVTELQARLQERTGNLESSRAQFELAEKVRANNQQLLDQGFISRNAFDNSQSSYQQAKGAVKANEAQLALAKKSLEDSIIRAPIDGIVAERLVQAGEKVAVDSKLFTVMDLSRMELAASIPNSDIGNVQLGQPVAFKVEGFGDREFTGQIDRINPATQNGSRSILVYAVIDNASLLLKGGMFAQGTILVEKLTVTTAAPMTAVREEGGLFVVYVIENGVLKRQVVTLGKKSEEAGLVEIAGGLEPGARVINGAFTNLRVGSKVRVSQVETPAKSAVVSKEH
ncbi:MAG TPA: efflux RND transporter periplasmic adaptor subunit [Burkholderiales bacterium]|nr:efflux RND transporter periplasmic adaptor subunit [Burkholderiales bacterium]